MFSVDDVIITTDNVCGQKENTIGKIIRICTIKAPTVSSEKIKEIFGQIILKENDIYTYKIEIQFDDGFYYITNLNDLSYIKLATEREQFLYHIFGPYTLK